MVNDTDGASTGWSTYSDVINVTNNVPSLSNYALSASTLLRNNTIVIGMNTTDTEDGESSHTVVIQYRTQTQDGLHPIYRQYGMIHQLVDGKLTLQFQQLHH